MRAYRKPTLEVELFEVNQNIADCTSQVAATKTYYAAQTVDCVINSAENIFYDSTCGHIASNGSLKTLADGRTYYFWQGDIYVQPTQKQQDDIDKLLDQVGLKGQPGWHVAPATASVTKIVNAS